ncbi:hypothetical protein J2W49_004711 [Hydrogenophaga palleronii]|uniref:Transglutaminase-like domain-containing protein n=1 Tax=Hydrogenophaga palleronii TaxID=65655 RepID=A0ABU1WTV2_9BURK|nr:transglutaminase domain-containing protein [Hydrogenophaga palleronii]MDR7152733.1 hypothetical protein [Hydrogenophaga palleronii]
MLKASAVGLGLAFSHPLFAAGCGNCATRVPNDQPAPIERLLRMRILFHNPSRNVLMDQRFWCYLPMHLAGQTLSSLVVSRPHHAATDPFGHQVLSVAFDRFPAYASIPVEISMRVRLDGTVCASQMSGSPSWLEAETHIESHAQEIQTLARQLRRPSERETVKAIYEWVQAALTYEGYVPQGKGALNALRTRAGDCTEYAALVVALARANAIPSRMVGGYVVDKDLLLRVDEYHDWAQVLLNGCWQTIDAQKRRWLPSDQHYLPFQIYGDKATNEMGHLARYRMDGDLEVQF